MNNKQVKGIGEPVGEIIKEEENQVDKHEDRDIRVSVQKLVYTVKLMFASWCNMTYFIKWGVFDSF